VSNRLSLKTVVFLAGLLPPGLASFVPLAQAAAQPAPAIEEAASAAVAQMGKSLQADRFSFQVRTLRVYSAADGQPLHIAHSMKVTLRRPDRLLVDLTGDDSSTSLFYNGKTAVLSQVEAKRYSTVPVPGTIQGMLETLMGRLGVDFPLADFLTDDPDKSFLFGITSGKEVGTATIDGVPCRHLLFLQPPGIDLELWVEKNNRSLPRRLIVTYRSLPDQPSFIAEMFNWNFSVQPSDAEFVFHPAADAVKVDLPAKASGANP
jgi:hypothetical protein